MKCDGVKIYIHYAGRKYISLVFIDDYFNKKTSPFSCKIGHDTHKKKKNDLRIDDKIKREKISNFHSQTNFLISIKYVWSENI